MLINGCSANRAWVEKINENAVLDEDEKAFAVRFYKLVNSGKIENAPKTSVSRLPDKWNIDDYNDLSIDEKKYLAYLPEALELRDIYYSIDLDNLTQKEQDFLKETHEQYGDKVNFNGDEIYDILILIILILIYFFFPYNTCNEFNAIKIPLLFSPTQKINAQVLYTYTIVT